MKFGQLSLRQIVAIAAMAALLIFLFISTGSVNPAKHHDSITRLGEVEKLDAELEEEVLKQRYHLQNNYDELVEVQGKIRALIHDLESGDNAITAPGNTEVNQEMAKLKRELGLKDELIEQFKSHNALLKNSLRYLPHLIDEALASNADPSLRPQLLSLMRNIMLLHMGGEKNYEAIQFELDQLKSHQQTRPPAHGEKLDPIMQHARMVLVAELEIDNIFPLLTSGGTRQMGQELTQAYNRTFERSLHQANIFRMFLFVVALLLLSYAGQAFLRLRENSSKLSEALNALENQQFALDQHAIVSASDVRGNIIYANDRFCQISQYRQEELAGQSHRIVNSGVHPPEFFKEMWHTIASGQVWHGEICNRAKDGSHYWVNSTIVPFMDSRGKPYQYISIRTDITARKLMEEQAAASNRFLHSLTDALGVGIYALDAQGCCTFLNREAEKLLGWSKEELMGKSIHDVVHFQTADGTHISKSECPTHKAIKQGETFRSDQDIFTRKDGSVFNISIVAVPLLDGDQVVGSVAGFQDITERKHTEQALSESEKKYRSVVESLNEVVFQTDWQGLWTYLNPVWTEITGYSVDESLETNMLHYIHADDRQRNFEQFMPLIERKKDFCRYEVRFLTKEGGYRWLEIFATLSLDEKDNIVGTTGVLNDVTERRVAEDRLRDQLQFTQQLIEVTPYPIYFQDVNGQYLGFNKTFEIFWGIERKEWIGKTAYDLLPRELADLHHEKDLLLLQQKDTQSYEAPVQAADRKIHDTIYQKAAFTRADGSVAGLIGIISDITKAKQSAAELKRAKEAAETANQAKSDFLANMSHEIRTPMNGIIGMTDLALDTELTPQQREYLGMVKYSADSLLTIINDILDFSKIEAGKMSMESIPFSLHNTLKETVKPMAMRAGQKGLSLNLELAPQVPDTLIGDPGRLRQILINLIGNAIKFTEQGKISVRVKPEYIFEQGVSLHFSVSDTGAGISKDKLQSIFDAFSQADSSITRKYGGTGLGLSITSRLVEMMNGKIWVESEEGVGSTFHFTAHYGLSTETVLESQAEPTGGLTSLGEHSIAHALTILLAEDNIINQRLAVTLLEKAGHVVKVAQNGREALELWEQEHFDLVLMDMQMPEMDGIEATQCIRAREKQIGGHIPIIAMTANAMEGDRELCLKAGMDAYVPKPIQPRILFAAIETTLKQTECNLDSPSRDETEQGENFDYAAAAAKTDPDILEIIGAMFLAEIPQYMANIESTLKQGEHGELQRAAHTLKGLLGNFGAKPAVSWAHLIEESAAQDNLDDASAHYRKLQEEISKFQPVLAAILSA
ncbi:MAG: hypothetical protein C3F18_01285 [Nitrosomonadales bacterium]|nr:MAG: hypothetical protein C3F18_01285 [Nitrosomonadales bacterium]